MDKRLYCLIAPDLPIEDITEITISGSEMKIYYSSHPQKYVSDHFCEEKETFYEVENVHSICHELKEWAWSNNIMFDVRWHTNRSPKRVSVMTYGKDSRFFCADGTEFGCISQMIISKLNSLQKEGMK